MITTEACLTYNKVLAPSAIEERLDRVIDMYQQAFAEAPWNEKTKCAIGREPSACPEGLSAVALGATCETCHEVVTEEAFPRDELIDRFTAPDDELSHPLWYVEETSDSQIALAVFAKMTTVRGVSEGIYEGDAAMQEWLGGRFPDPEERVVWLADVFADTNVRASGNLRNFKSMCTSLARGIAPARVMFKTMNPKLVRAAQRDFDDHARVADPVLRQVPNRAKFVDIDLSQA